MELIKDIVESYGLTVTYTTNTGMWIKAKNTIIMCNIYELFGLEKSDLMLHLKQKFVRLNVNVDLDIPENNKRISTKSKKYITISDRKKKIRNLLENKFKLIS